LKQKPSQRIGYYPPQPVSSQHTPLKSAVDHHAFKKSKLSPLSVRLIFIIICLFVFCMCLFLLLRYAYNIVITRNASQQLENAYQAAYQQNNLSDESNSFSFTQDAEDASVPPPYPTTGPSESKILSADELWPKTYPGNPALRVSSVFYQLQSQNEDIVGWLKIDGLLEEAVVQRDNEYYLTHNALKQKSVTGALFLDENCNLDIVPTQMLIHGHNMKEGAMFGALKKYKVKDASFYREHPFIDFNTIYENGRYVIFAVAEVDIRSGKPDYLPFWHNTRFASADAFMEYVERAKLLSYYRCNVDVQPGDRLLALSTCTSIDDNKRLIIMARKLRENENELELNIGIYSTSDR